MTPEQVAQRHQYRTGYRLVDYAEVGLPVYLLTVRALTLAHKRISPIEEFVLKAVDIGLQTAGEVASFLGLQERVVKGTLTELALSESISLTPTPGSRNQMLRLTQKGKKSVELAETIEPEEHNFQIYFDGIIREVAWYGNVHLLRYREVNELGLLEIPTTDQRRPQVEDLRIQDIQSIVRSRAGASDYKRDLLTIKAIDRCERMFLSAVALVFKSEVGGEVQVGFAVDGKLSPSHEKAFAQAGGPQQLRIEEQLMKASAEREEVLAFHKEVAVDMPATNDIAQLERTRSQAQQEMGKLEEQLDRTEAVGERQAVESRLATVKEQYKHSQNELDGIGVRFVYVHEHPAILQDALENSTTRLAINSPWIKRAVVNADFIRKLERLLEKDVQVYIAWGVGNESEEKSDKSALEALRRLMHRYDTFRIRRVGDTHAKVLVCDRKYAVVTSFNWLSFRGDPNRTFRDEQGTMVRIPELVDQKFDYLLGRLEAEEE